MMNRGENMNNQFIRGIKFEWDNIPEDSYLRKIEALKDIESLEFSNPITFFVGEMVQESQLCLKQ